MNSSVRRSSTSSAGESFRATSIARHSRVYSSMMVSIRKAGRRASCSARSRSSRRGPCAPAAAARTSRRSATVGRVWAVPGAPSALPAPDPLHPLVVHPPALLPQHGRDPAVAVPAVLASPAPTICRDRAAARRRAAADCRRCVDAAGPAPDTPDAPRPSVSASRTCSTAAPLRRAQKFPGAASFRMALSKDRSATSFFSRAFSCSSSLSRFAWSIRRPPYSLRQR